MMHLLLALPTLDGIWKIVVFLFMLSVLVVLHEGGHFLVARRNGVRVNDFAVGFGPTLLKWTSPRSGTNYRLNAFPLGGYCAMQGEDGRSSEADQQRAFREEPDAAVAVTTARTSDNFQAKRPLQRLAIVVAGPIANFLLAFVILFFGAVTFGIATDSLSTVIGTVNANSPGGRAGLAAGDRIVAINGAPIRTGRQMVDVIRGSANKPLAIAYVRHGGTNVVTLTPQAKQDEGKTVGIIGFIRMNEYRRVGPVQAVGVAVQGVRELFVGNVDGIRQLVTHPAEDAAKVSGVIGMERVASQVQDLGWGPYLQIAAAISMALGIFNLLPVPALDGGRAIFILAEMLRGRPVDPEKEALVHVTGFAVLMVLMVFVAYHDIANVIAGKAAL